MTKKINKQNEKVFELTRKQRRKQEQQLKKEKKRLFFSKKEDEASHANKPDHVFTKKRKLHDNVVNANTVEEELVIPLQRKKEAKPKQQIQAAERPDAIELRKQVLRRKKELESASRKHRIKHLREENEEEDKTIARLEKKLKINKSKNKKHVVRKMFNDGLDYALEFCMSDDDNDDGDKAEISKSNKKLSDDSDDELDIGDEMGITDDGSCEDEDNDDNSDGSIIIDEASNSKKQEEFVEDIYGRKRDKDGNVIQNEKYIPPHQRALMTLQSDDKHSQIMDRLLKQCKGLLNRLSEANLHKIAIGLEELYMKNSRHNMNETLTKLLNEALITKNMSKSRMVQEYMVVLAFLHAQVGSEIGAHFLQVFINIFEQFFTDISNIDVEDKRIDNLVLTLAYMYILKMYDHRLLLEIIEKLTGNLCEKTIECLLLIFKSVGFKLRKDDPLLFKQILMDVQKKIAESPLELKENLRLKFMVEVLNAIKNNNVHKIPQFDPELVENLRKALKAMIRNDKYVITLNITFDDLLHAEKLGKWWITGSAWSGASIVNSAKKNASNPQSGQLFSEKLLALAKQQKMNTEERRNIFCIIMSAEDYVDAFEKIHHLALKDQRIVAYVVIQCCLNEKLSNPYYSYLALKFCQFNRKFQLAFQFAIWDQIKEINMLTNQNILNMANFLKHLFLKGGLSVSILRVVDFMQLNSHSLSLMKKTMLGVLLDTNESDVYQIFERIAKNSNFKQFKNSIRLFFQHFLLQQELKLNTDQHELLKKRISFVDNLLAFTDL